MLIHSQQHNTHIYEHMKQYENTLLQLHTTTTAVLVLVLNYKLYVHLPTYGLTAYFKNQFMKSKLRTIFRNETQTLRYDQFSG